MRPIAGELLWGRARDCQPAKTRIERESGDGKGFKLLENIRRTSISSYAVSLQPLQLLDGPQLVPKVGHRLDSNTLIDPPHVLGAELRNTDADRMFLALRMYRYRGTRR